MFKLIYRHLKSSGFDCYSIGQHKGICEKEYIVIKNNTPRALSKTMLEEEVELFLYYPLGEYSKFIDYIDSVRSTMKGLDLKDNFIQYPIIVEDDKKAYMTILSYQNNRERVL
ncbi:hypothetical protein [Paraclostridium bifermentans]|uniref:hypothetical protein n=1 Tax=Paraclostridium bifermentans TaxID=1490 RepID=UPI00115B8339|nr:hypothetical protein [Paraclostridium bifermentans]TQO55820.1 hypothetical protein D5S05_16830 [Paraclostridium bifermentans]